MKNRGASFEPCVVQAQEEMATAYNTFVADSSSFNSQAQSQKKEALFYIYNAVRTWKEEHFTSHKSGGGSCKSKACKELASYGRRSAQITKGIIKGESDKPHVEAWYNHFKNLLGNPQTLLDKDEEN